MYQRSSILSESSSSSNGSGSVSGSGVMTSISGSASSGRRSSLPWSLLAILIMTLIFALTTSRLLMTSSSSDNTSTTTSSISLKINHQQTQPKSSHEVQRPHSSSSRSHSYPRTIEDVEKLYRQMTDEGCSLQQKQSTASESEQDTTGEEEDNLFLFLHKPHRPFHGNHWYHYAEHYLSRRREIQRLLSLILQTRQQQRNKQIENEKEKQGRVGVEDGFQLSSSGSRPVHLYILTNEPKNFFMATPMSFFFAMITAWMPGINTVSFVYSIQSVEQILSQFDIDSLKKTSNKRRTSASTSERCDTDKGFALLSNKVQVEIYDKAFHFDHSESIQRRFSSEYQVIHSGSSSGGSSQQTTASTTTTTTSTIVYDTIQSIMQWVSKLFTSPPVYNYKASKETITTISGYFIGSFGSNPLPSTQWFQDHAETEALRLSVNTICEGSQHLLNQALSFPSVVSTQSSSTSSSSSTVGDALSSGMRLVVTPKIDPKTDAATASAKSIVRILIYQRDEKRKLLNIEKLWTDDARLQVLQALYPALEVIVVDHMEERHPCLIQQLFHQADILITSHGFQLTGLIFMRPYTSVFEVFPYKYFKPSYFPLVEMIHLRHQWFQSMRRTSSYLSHLSTETCMKDQACRSFARTHDIVLNDDNLNTIQIFIINILLGFTPTTEPPLLPTSFFYPEHKQERKISKLR